MIVAIISFWLLVFLSLVILSWVIDAFLEAYDSRLRDKIRNYFKKFRGV
jgi:hypothetical protein